MRFRASSIICPHSFLPQQRYKTTGDIHGQAGPRRAVHAGQHARGAGDRQGLPRLVRAALLRLLPLPGHLPLRVGEGAQKRLVLHVT